MKRIRLLWTLECSLAISLVANAVQAGVLLDLPAALTAFFAAMPAILFAVMRRRMGRMLIDEQVLGQTSEILESVGDAFYAVDRQFRFTYLNRKALEQIGSPRGQLIGRPFLDVFPQAEGSGLHDSCIQVMRDGKAREFVGVSPILKRWKSYLVLPRPDGGLLVHSRDISAQKAAEAAMHESEKRLRLAAHAARFGTYDWDVANGLLFWSPESHAIHGFDRSGPIACEHAFRLIHPEDRSRVAEAVERGLDPGGMGFWAIDYRIVRPDGQTRWINAQSHVVFEGERGDRKAIRVIGTLQDVTDRNATQQALLSERMRFKTVVEHVPVGLLLVEVPSGRTLVGNRQAERITGCRIPENPAAWLLERWKGHDENGREIAAADQPLAITMATGEPAELTALSPRDDGSMAWLRITSAPTRDPDGTVTGIVVTIVDIDAERRGADTLRDSEARLRRAVENAPFPVMVHAEDGTVVHLSRAWLSITGYAAEDIRTVAGWARLAYGDDADTIMARVRSLFQQDCPIDERENVVRTADGSRRTWSFRSAPIGRDIDGRRLVVTMAVDLTERKENEARLHLLMREVDHRAKNALAVVQSILHLTRAENPADFTAAIEGRLAAMARAHTLLAASRWSGADLAALIVDELAPFASAGRIAVQGPAVSIAAEAAQAVAMCLHELSTNAAKYGALSAPAGRLELSWRMEGQEGGGSLVLDWRETGGPPVTPPDRTGFGSMVLRQTVESQLGGDLVLDWNPAGLCCRIALPTDCFSAAPAAEPLSEAVEQGGSAKLAGPGARVLVVEDEALTALAMEQVLLDAGLAVLGPVGRVEDALDLLRETVPDVAVLDVNLFGRTVFPVAERLQALGVPFLFCSGYSRLDDLSENLRRAPLLAKPVLADHLIATLSGLIAKCDAGVT
ncbi:PAS domain S-box protein [Skermanella sp. TT6]|uniref:histidine kinase n=1 Tax=Skermanella cutis TaxID=2775420 RepID=A0ABX7BBZ2_9PROT|nr:PAS domain S-box protein [Skermanella sp. TT6]QQP91896.1 PAS domain S-box protein [Skermanella sp. TT6]